MHQRVRSSDLKSTTRNEIADICSDPFDLSLRKPCVTLAWQPRFFYNETAERCQMFWYDTSCEATGRTRNIFGYLSTCRRLCEPVTADHNVRHRPRPKTIGKITAMFTRDRGNATTQSFSDRSQATSIGTKTSLPRFIVTAKLTDYPSTVSNARIEQSRQLTYASSFAIEGHSTRSPIRLGKISVTYSKYSESDNRNLGETGAKTSTTARTFDTGSYMSSMHPNKIEENEVRSFENAMDANLQPRTASVFGDVASNIIGGEDKPSKEGEISGGTHLDEGDVSKFDIGQQFSLQFATAVAVAVDCLDSFDTNLTRSCGYGEWTARYYFNAGMRTCQMFWSDGCRSLSRNNFDDLASCQWKCEGTHPKPQSSETPSHFIAPRQTSENFTFS
ncbi:unnamed protein product [Toxocara canis]|uniref:BPTI/Kunitz inhibitor domain-containing protein n=1 Tax=Toxocara canis TaxID=6265 RepID=A0A3P7HCK1_TOXCA|nr:unnamed protein product [Toxocara canis]